MQNHYQSFILNTLISKYEKSKHVKEEAKINRRVTFQFTPQYFSDYYKEGLQSPRGLINEIILKMEQKGLISIDWVKYEVGNLIEQLHLNIDRIDDCYKVIGRTPLRDEINEAIKLIQSHLDGYSRDWIQQFLKACLSDLEQKKMPPSIGKNIEGFHLLLMALKGIEEQNGLEIAERLFSTRYLGNSKVFEKQVRAKLVSLLHTHYPVEDNDIDDMDTDALLQEVGILKGYEEAIIKGNIQIQVGQSVMDYNQFQYGTSIDSLAIRSGYVLSADADKVLIIENKAVFKEVVRKMAYNEPLSIAHVDLTTLYKNGLIIYLGGFPGPDKRNLLKKVITALPDSSEVFFWGDIDYGGIQIYFHLKNKVDNRIKPFLMDIDILQTYKVHVEEFEENYQRKLEKMKDKKGMSQLIQYMVHNKVKLEQECLVI